MFDVRKGDKIAKKTWCIEKDIAEKLVATVEAEKNNPPYYNILGDESISNKGSASISSQPVGHNCYTWIKKTLQDLKQNSITFPDNHLWSWIACPPSWTLKTDAFHESLIHKYFGSFILIWLVSILIALVAIYWLLYIH